MMSPGGVCATDEGAPPVHDARDERGEAPLSKAAEGGHLAVVHLLLRAGAPVDPHDRRGESPLFKAAQSNRVEVVRALIAARARVKWETDAWDTPLLWWPVTNGYDRVVELLLAAGAYANWCSPLPFRRSLVYMAAMNGHAGIVRQLLRKGAWVNRVSNDFDTPLSAAASRGHVAAVLALLEGGASVKPIDDRGCTALWYAEEHQHWDIVHILRHPRRHRKHAVLSTWLALQWIW